eukprot:2508886-Amphidinium_carterae.1
MLSLALWCKDENTSLSLCQPANKAAPTTLQHTCTHVCTSQSLKMHFDCQRKQVARQRIAAQVCAGNPTFVPE